MFYCVLHVTLLSTPGQHCRAVLYKFHIVIVMGYWAIGLTV